MKHGQEVMKWNSASHETELNDPLNGIIQSPQKISSTNLPLMRLMLLLMCDIQGVLVLSHSMGSNCECTVLQVSSPVMSRTD